MRLLTALLLLKVNTAFAVYFFISIIQTTDSIK